MTSESYKEPVYPHVVSLKLARPVPNGVDRFGVSVTHFDEGLAKTWCKFCS
jgi:hypothetical protein